MRHMRLMGRSVAFGGGLKFGCSCSMRAHIQVGGGGSVMVIIV